MVFNAPHPLLFIALVMIAFATQGTAEPQEEVLRPGDQIPLNIGEDPPDEKATIVGLFTVSKEGTLRLPRLKEELQVVGLRPSVLMDNILKAYRDQHVFKNPKAGPHVTIAVKMTGQAQRFVTVSGEVMGAGDVPFRPDLTLLAAISACSRSFSKDLGGSCRANRSWIW